MKAEDFKKVYSDLGDVKLIDLYKTRDTLNPQAVTVLTEELEKRGILKLLSEENPEENTSYDFTDEELKDFINVRLEEGESMESINIDLLNHGIDIKKRLREDVLKEQEIIDYHLNQSAEGKTKAEIYEDLKTRYRITEDKIEAIKKKHKPHGIIYLCVGIFTALFAVVNGVLFLYNEGNTGAQARYLLVSVAFFLLAYKAIKKYRVLKS